MKLCSKYILLRLSANSDPVSGLARTSNYVTYYLIHRIFITGYSWR